MNQNNMNSVLDRHTVSYTTKIRRKAEAQSSMTHVKPYATCTAQEETRKEQQKT